MLVYRVGQGIPRRDANHDQGRRESERRYYEAYGYHPGQRGDGDQSKDTSPNTVYLKEGWRGRFFEVGDVYEHPFGLPGEPATKGSERRLSLARADHTRFQRRDGDPRLVPTFIPGRFVRDPASPGAS